MINALEAARPHLHAATARSTSRSRRCPTYGKLARLDHEGIQAGARVDSDEYDKEDARDFVLWKATKPGEPTWDVRLRTRPARLAHRVLGDGAAAARRVADRHPHRRRRSGVPASRERDRAERRRDRQGVLALLVPRRAPARRQPEDVEVGRQLLHGAGRPRQGLPAVGAALHPAVGATTASSSISPGSGCEQAEEALRRITDFLGRVDALHGRRRAPRESPRACKEARRCVRRGARATT